MYKSQTEGFSDLRARLKSGLNVKLIDSEKRKPGRAEIDSFSGRCVDRDGLFNHLHLNIVPERFRNLNRAVGLLVGFDQRDEYSAVMRSRIR